MSKLSLSWTVGAQFILMFMAHSGVSKVSTWIYLRLVIMTPPELHEAVKTNPGSQKGQLHLKIQLWGLENRLDLGQTFLKYFQILRPRETMIEFGVGQLMDDQQKQKSKTQEPGCAEVLKVHPHCFNPNPSSPASFWRTNPSFSTLQLQRGHASNSAGISSNSSLSSNRSLQHSLMKYSSCLLQS